jgi:hypothetical protein
LYRLWVRERNAVELGQDSRACTWISALRSSRVSRPLVELGSIVSFEGWERFERSNNTKFYIDGEWADP